MRDLWTGRCTEKKECLIRRGTEMREFLRRKAIEKIDSLIGRDTEKRESLTRTGTERKDSQKKEDTEKMFIQTIGTDKKAMIRTGIWKISWRKRDTKSVNQLTKHGTESRELYRRTDTGDEVV